MPIPNTHTFALSKTKRIIKTGRQAILVIANIKMRCQRQLFKVANTMNPFGDCFGASQRRQKNGRQNANDGNDDQQLN